MVMNDFLRNLRSSHKKETPPPRKNLDNQYYSQPSQSDRRMMLDRRTKINSNSGPGGSGGSGSASMDILAKTMGEILPMVLDNTSLLAEQVEKIAAINEMVAESTIRKNNAVADFFDGLGEILAAPPQPGMQGSAGSVGPVKATASYASGTHYTKDDILSIIQNMRDQGGTFAIIADYLKEKGIPTFSGRGEWHAQTIHRLCK